MRSLAALVLLSGLGLSGCRTWEVWPPPGQRSADCALPVTGWLLTPVLVRSAGKHGSKAGEVSERLSRLSPLYLRDGRGYGLEPAPLDRKQTHGLQEWAWGAAPGTPVPAELMAWRSDAIPAPDPGSLVLVQGSYHPRSVGWFVLAAATGFLLWPVLTVGSDLDLRADVYALPGGEHLWRIDHGRDALPFDPVSPGVWLTRDLLHPLPRAGQPCSSAPEP